MTYITKCWGEGGMVAGEGKAATSFRVIKSIKWQFKRKKLASKKLSRECEVISRCYWGLG